MKPRLVSGTLQSGTVTEALIHVRYSDTGTWVVELDDRADPISEHWSETAAERAAIVHAACRGDCEVLVHDRYARVHFVGRQTLTSEAPVSPAQASDARPRAGPGRAASRP